MNTRTCRQIVRRLFWNLQSKDLPKRYVALQLATV